MVVILEENPFFALRQHLLESVPVLGRLQVVSPSMDQEHLNRGQGVLQVLHRD